MLKIVATISNFGAAVNVGGGVEMFSEIINIPTNDIPPNLKSHLEDKKRREWETVSLSILKEEI